MSQETKLSSLIAKIGDVSDDGVLHCAGQSISAIAADVGTPFYLYNGDNLREQVRTVKAALGEGVGLFFSLKANPGLGICQLMASEGVGAELASIGELHVARTAGFEPSAAIFAGPGKTNDELEEAISWGIASINVESEGELQRVGEIAERLQRKVRVCLRINPVEQVKGAQMRMGGGPSQFGIDEERVPAVVEQWRGHSRVKIVGIHVYVGTQLFDVPAMLKHDEHVVHLARQVAEGVGSPLEMVDFGGGFAVPYFETSAPFDLEAFAVGFKEIVGQMKSSELLRDALPIIELGRYLVADSGLYVTRVVDTKKSREKSYVVTDGGMNHHITATGNFGQVFKKAYPMAVLNRLNVAADCAANVVGPCCTPLDVLGQKVTLADVALGDLIGVFYSGAYGYSASSLAFLSHPTPAEVLVLGETYIVLRKQGAPNAVLEGQIALESGLL